MSPPKTKKCPACRSEVAYEAVHCPNCPNSFEGEEHGIQSNRGAPSVVKPLLAAAALAAAALGVWRVLGFVMRCGDAEGKDNLLAKAAQTQAPLDALRQNTSMAPLSTSRPPDAAAAPEEPSQEIIIGASERRKRAEDWKLRGVVYDLVTLRPVPRATILVQDAALNRRFELTTDAQGRYRTILPALPDRGYAVSFSHQDYARSCLGPESEGARDKPIDERKRLAAELARDLGGSCAVQGFSGGPVVTDFYLAPR